MEPPRDGHAGTSLPESAQATIAEQVMRAVLRDPAVLDRAMAGDADALGTLRSVVQTVASGLAVITRNEEERDLVARLIGEGKSGAEIQAELDAYRTRAGVPSRIDLPENPDDLLKEGWIETSHPEAAAKGRRTFEHPVTGEKLAFDKGQQGKTGFRVRDHYHRLNPDLSDRENGYLDIYGNPVREKQQQVAHTC